MTYSKDKYRVFRRTAANFEEFAKARKVTQERGLTWDQARRMCDEFNNNRTAAQVRNGTKFEFERE
ncbi:MAG: hypothetical protein KGL39_07225 [Patescibacteria group bacterium]|nr:hypothetical protein [Patescibacteria group bacterium]